MKKALTLIMILCFALGIYAGNDHGDKGKTRALTGKVVDLHGESVAGVVITVKETGEQFFSDFEGNFCLSLPLGQNCTIVFSGIGLVPKEVASNELFSFSEQLLEPLK